MTLTNFALSVFQQQDGPEPMDEDGSPFVFFPRAPEVLFCKKSPPLTKVLMPKQPISRKSAPKGKAAAASRAAAPRAPTRTRQVVKKVPASRALKQRSPTPDRTELARKLTHVPIDFTCLYRSLQHNLFIDISLLQASSKDNSSEDTQSIQGESSPERSEETAPQDQPDSPPSASRKRSAPETAAPKLNAKQGQVRAPRSLVKNRRLPPPTKRSRM